jgi:putative ABC transport system permease protein
MFGYYLELALRSLKRSPILTALMVLAIGLGIGASMTMITVLHVMTNDPLPARSAQLFTPHLDPLPLDYKQSSDSPDATDNLTWPDAMALLKAHRGKRQAAMAGGSLLVRPAREGLQPFYVNGRYATADIFAMFGVPFERGQGWSAADDGARARVIVLSDTLNRKLFGNADSIGQMVRLGDSDYRVIGVITDWRPQPMFYGDMSAQQFGDPDQYFLPLSVAVDLKLDINGNRSSWVKAVDSGMLTSDGMSWLQFWVQLDSRKQVDDYRRFLLDYSAEQKVLGRFQRPPTNAKLYSLMGWLTHENLVPNDVHLQLWLALGFLFVCMTNIVALLLAKFLRRASAGCISATGYGIGVDWRGRRLARFADRAAGFVEHPAASRRLRPAGADGRLDAVGHGRAGDCGQRGRRLVAGVACVPRGTRSATENPVKMRLPR